MIGEFLGAKKPSNRQLCEEYFRLYRFQGMQVDQGLRHVFYKMKLPKES